MDGAKIGSIGHIGCFSFTLPRIWACGDGGAVTTNDPTLRQIRNATEHGEKLATITTKSASIAVWMPLRAILQIKLRYLNTWNDQRRVIAARYNQFLKLPNLVTPQELPGAQGVWNQYTIRITSDQGLICYLSGQRTQPVATSEASAQ